MTRQQSKGRYKYALKTGKIKRGDVCADCGGAATDGHHVDYSRPLDVVWLCQLCHLTRHGLQPKTRKTPSRTIKPRLIYVQTTTHKMHYVPDVESSITLARSKGIDMVSWASLKGLMLDDTDNPKLALMLAEDGLLAIRKAA